MNTKHVITVGAVGKDYGVQFEAPDNTSIDSYLKSKGLSSLGNAVKKLNGR